MPQSVIFLRIRTISFGCIMLLSFLWIVLHCLCLFGQWDIMDHTERSLILIMLFIDTITVIMLPILLLQSFRPWLDAARLFFLAVFHGGIAVFFAIKRSSFQCISPVDDQVAVCNLIILYVSVTTWFIPMLVIFYACGLAFLIHRRSKAQTTPKVEDLEKQKAEGGQIAAKTTPDFDDYHLAI